MSHHHVPHLAKVPALCALLLFAGSGCLRPFTDRMDYVIYQIEMTNANLAATTQKLEDADRRLIRMEQHLSTAAEQFTEVNKKLGTLESAAKKLLPGIP